jgi:hypothetical protein
MSAERLQNFVKRYGTVGVATHTVLGKPQRNSCHLYSISVSNDLGAVFYGGIYTG